MTAKLDELVRWLRLLASGHRAGFPVAAEAADAITTLRAQVAERDAAGVREGAEDMRDAIAAKLKRDAEAHVHENWPYDNSTGAWEPPNTASEEYVSGLEELAEEIARLPLPAAPAITTAAGGPGLTAAAQDVFAERQRQVTAEGWTPEHDDQHEWGELASAAAVYAAPDGFDVASLWPWDLSCFKPASRRQELVKAGALILAEIERLDRALAPNAGGA